MLFFVLTPTITNPLQVKNECILFMAAINNEKGEIFVMHNTMWQVGFSEQHGITINHIADVHGTPC